MPTETMILLGGLLLICAVTMRKTLRRSRREDDPARDVSQSLTRAERSAWGLVHRLEARLLDSIRDTEARLVTERERLAALIAQAETTADRLENLLPHVTGLADDQELRRAVHTLREIGYSAREIATLTDRPLTDIQKLHEDRPAA